MEFNGALRDMLAGTAEIHAALSAVRASLALTIGAIYEGGVLSLRYDGDKKRLVDRNLEYRLELSEAFERMANDSLTLEGAVSAWRKQIDAWTVNPAIPEGVAPEPHFRQLLKKMEGGLEGIHRSFCLFLAKSLFLKLGLEFSNSLFGLVAAEGDPLSSQLIANIHAVIEDLKRCPTKLGVLQLGRIMTDFVSARATALSSFEDQSVKSFDEALSDCGSLTTAFMLEADILAADGMP